MKVLLTAVAVLITLCGPVSSLSTGAPAAACSTLSPNPAQHGAPAQTSAVPYYVYVDPPLCTNGYLTYNPGQEYTLGVRGRSDEDTFRGFFVQARMAADDTTNLGEFGEAAASMNTTRLSSCTPNTIGVTHSQALADVTGIYFNWTAPAAGSGSLRFGFAVVRTQAVYWANQRSPMIAEAGTSEMGAACGANAGALQLASVGLWTLLVVALGVVIKAAL